MSDITDKISLLKKLHGATIGGRGTMQAEARLFDACRDYLPDVLAEVERLEEQLHFERLRLATCGVAARGTDVGAAAQAFGSDSLNAVMQQQAEVERLRVENVELKDVTRMQRTYVRATADDWERLQSENKELRAEVERLNGLLPSMANGRSQFRNALREARADNARLREALGRLKDLASKFLKHVDYAGGHGAAMPGFVGCYDALIAALGVGEGK